MYTDHPHLKSLDNRRLIESGSTIGGESFSVALRIKWNFNSQLVDALYTSNKIIYIKNQLYNNYYYM